ncbi:MAG: helix-turn-helix transcriptional regulator [Elusimicrobia bacterium]|nr:helix-turn-helix transcriptional regulator [Elusimicrobiota bacterium]
MRHKPYLFEDYLKKQMKRPSFRKTYEKEYLKAGIAIRIAQLRQQKGISQKEFARRLGASQQMVSDIETGKQSNLTLATLQRIAEAFGRRLIVDFR